MDWEEIPLDERDPAYDRTPFINYARKRRTDKEERDPDIGDAVHFWDSLYASCRAAIVTQADLESVWLNYLYPGETSWRCVWGVPHDEDKRQASWHWPCGGQ